MASTQNICEQSTSLRALRFNAALLKMFSTQTEQFKKTSQHKSLQPNEDRLTWGNILI